MSAYTLLDILTAPPPPTSYREQQRRGGLILTPTHPCFVTSKLLQICKLTLALNSSPLPGAKRLQGVCARASVCVGSTTELILQCLTDIRHRVDAAGRNVTPALTSPIPPHAFRSLPLN